MQPNITDTYLGGISIQLTFQTFDCYLISNIYMHVCQTLIKMIA